MICENYFKVTTPEKFINRTLSVLVMERDDTPISRNVLVVDDNPADLVLIHEHLKPSYQVSTLNNVNLALPIVDSGVPLYFVLADLVMPVDHDKNGIDLIRILKAKGGPIPVIATSGEATPEVSALAIKSGAIDFIDKSRLKAPGSEKDLAAVLRQMETSVTEFHTKYREERKQRERATKDAVTGLFNRQQLDDDLDQEIARHNRRIHRGEESPLSLLFIDINDMNLANGSLGHAYVDANLLRSASHAIKKSLFRELDRGYRYGGDELVVVLPETEPDGARLVAERIIDRYHTQRDSFTYDQYRGVSPNPIEQDKYEKYKAKYGNLSIGVASAPMEKMRREVLISMGNIAMYNAKATGKSKVPPQSYITVYRPGMIMVKKEGVTRKS